MNRRSFDRLEPQRLFFAPAADLADEEKAIRSGRGSVREGAIANGGSKL